MTDNDVDKRIKELFFSDMLKSKEFIEGLTEEQQNELKQLIIQYKELHQDMGGTN